MDCGLVHCVASLNLRPRPLKQKSSKKYGDLEVEPDRDWPVDPKEYAFLHKAGKGASAVVFCARCKPFDEVVAVKKLDLDARCNYDLTALTREATMMKRLQHPHVLPLYTSFVAGRELWMVMPYMAYGSLRSIMKREGLTEGIDEVVIATVMKCVLEGLDYLHQNGGIHRDVKADNILISASGDVRLADFGVAAARARQVSMINLDMAAVMAKTFVGTPCWMAPEVMTQTDEGYNSSADIWSFGITMIELATGKPPLARAHPMRILMDTINNPPPSLDDHPRGHCYSKCMKEVVDACLDKDPCKRPSAAELLDFKFFRMARDASFLVEHFLSGLTPPTDVSNMPGAAAAAAGPELLGGILRGRSAVGLQDLALGRIASRIKSTWYFPGAKSLANMANMRKAKRSTDSAGDTPVCCEHEEDNSAAAAAAGQAGATGADVTSTGIDDVLLQKLESVLAAEDAAEMFAAGIASRSSSTVAQLGSFTTAGSGLLESRSCSHCSCSSPSLSLEQTFGSRLSAHIQQQQYSQPGTVIQNIQPETELVLGPQQEQQPELGQLQCVHQPLVVVLEAAEPDRNVCCEVEVEVHVQGLSIQAGGQLSSKQQQQQQVQHISVNPAAEQDI